MSAKYLHYSYEQLKTFCMDAFQEFGFNSEEAQIITDVLLLSDLRGSTLPLVNPRGSASPLMNPRGGASLAPSRNAEDPPGSSKRSATTVSARATSWSFSRRTALSRRSAWRACAGCRIRPRTIPRRIPSPSGSPTDRWHAIVSRSKPPCKRATSCAPASRAEGNRAKSHDCVVLSSFEDPETRFSANRIVAI